MKILKALFLIACVQFPFQIMSAEFPYHPTREITLIKGLQINEHPVTTNNKEAKAYFNQGLNLIYGFNHDQAYWSFQKAVALDENFAMGYWGMALSLGPNINMDIDMKAEKIAYGHIRKALELTDKVSNSERDYIYALSKRYSDVEKPDLKKLNIDYSNAMNALRTRYPDDPDAAVLYAESAMDLNPWKQWDKNGDPLPGTLEIVEALESVLKRMPNHLGANHYYIHAVEASKHPEYALINAERLKKLAPALGHILHMPSHIYLLVGDYAQAVLSNEAAIVADLSTIRQYGIEGIYPVHYLSHNYYFLIRALSMEGKFKGALRASNDLEKLYLPHVEDMPSLEYYLSAKMFLLARFHKWNELLQLQNPTLKTKSKLPITETLWHFSRALAYASLNDEVYAMKERQAFLTSKKEISKDAIFGFNKVDSIFRIAENVLDAKFAKMQLDFKKEIEFLKEAVRVQDELNYNEPPDWFFPVRESLGGALLQSNQYKEAEAVFREDLRRHPRNGRSLFGLLLSLKGQSRESDSYFVQKEFDQAWSNSDEPLLVTDL
jgi:tetratricopeptide (TPR) repeat protein